MTAPDWAERRTSFGSAAASYADGRPHYPAETLMWGLPAGARTVLDLAAGTGILTADLLDLGVDVVAVEPLAEMRALIPAAAQRLDGTAEAIPLGDGAVDAITVGQAWHWFDADHAVVEAHRVIRPGGTLLLVWNLLDTSDPLSRSIADLLRTDLERTDMMLDESEPPYDAPTLFDDHERLLMPHVQGYDADRVVAYALSRSQAILLEDSAREELVAHLRAVMPDEPFALHWMCDAWRAIRQ